MTGVWKRGFAAATTLSAVLAAVVAVRAAGPTNRPVYIGARACAQCHESADMGHQHSKWMRTKHAQAWASLAKPESAEIARISGLREAPQHSPVCLGCHAVASEAEAWERDEAFRIEDGIQCEGCHGAGSEYANAATMRDKKAAMKAGLKMPNDRFCMVCHIEKGSHTNVLPRSAKPFDFKQVKDEIAHPLAKKGSAALGALPEARVSADEKSARMVGSLRCGGCHNEAAKGAQWSTWRMSPHAQAWSVLSSPKGLEIAKQQGVVGDPSRADKCLTCHAPGAKLAAVEGYTVDEGVGCEACHGAGSRYVDEKTMRDRAAAMKAGLRMPQLASCATCHANAHGKAFDVKTAWAKIQHPARHTQTYTHPRYLNPLRLALRPHSTEIYVGFEAAGTVGVVDTATRKKLAEINVGNAPTGIAFAPDGRTAYVTNREDDTLSVIDCATRKVTKTVKVGNEPHGISLDKAGKRIYVANTSSGDIHVLDAAKLQRTKVLSAGRGPWSTALSPDGAQLLVTNTYSQFVKFRTAPVSEVTVIETERATIDDRVKVPGANLMMGVAWHPSGEYAIATLNRTKNLLPMSQLVQGWTITNGVAIVWKDGHVDEVLLDDAGMGFADATDIFITPNGKYALATSSGTDRVAVIDLAKLIAVVKRTPEKERATVLPNHMGLSVEFVKTFFKTQASPRGVVTSADGRYAYVANSLDDSLSVYDLTTMKPAGVIDLGGPKQVTQTRFGERLFHNANIAHHRQFSCHSCHPDGHVDGLNYDIEADGIGVSPVDNRTLRGILDTAPFKWEGTNPSLSRQCGARLSVFFTRLLPFASDELKAVDRYITTIQRPPNRYRALGAKLTPAQQRGRIIYEREVDNSGKPIPELGRCVVCHPAPYYTDRQVHDVGTKQPSDRTGKFDVPHLKNIYDSAPYLHNGMAHTLEEIWTIYNPYDTHGVTNDLTKDQLNDLIEYLKTL